MSATARKEVLGQLIGEANSGLISLSNSEAQAANRQLRTATESYELARKRVLREELARHYRVAIFGSARLEEDSEEFKFVTNLTRALVEARDVDIVTGGGPGIMKAALLGATLAFDQAAVQGVKLNSRNHGISLSTLPEEQNQKNHIHLGKIHTEFSTRLQNFLDITRAAYIAEGGIGTLLELLILTQSKQVDHIENDYPILAHPFFEPVVSAWNNQLYNRRIELDKPPLISEKDLHIIAFTDKVPEIVDVICQSYDRWQDQIRSFVQIKP